MLNRLAILLLLPLVLVGCGVANIDQPLVESSEDVTAPRIASIKFDKAQLSGNVISLPSLNLKSIVIEFSEPLDEASLADTLIDTTLEGNWEYDAGSNSIVFTLGDEFKLDYNQTYTMTISGTIRDLAGNTLLNGDYSLTIVTPSAHKVSVTVEGLASGAELVVTLRDDISGVSESQTFTGGSADGPDFALLIPQRYRYSVLLGEPSSGQICTGGGSFIMGQRDVDVVLSCSDVYPLYSNAPAWNDYLAGVGGIDLAVDQPACASGAEECFHGGIYRVFPVSELESCEGVQIRDELDALNWVCRVDGQGIQAVSTGLQAGKRLADLLDFGSDPVTWKANRVIVSAPDPDDGQMQQVASSALSVWWSNPILPAGRNMDQAGAVYVYAEPNYDFTFYGSQNVVGKIALVIKPGVVLRGQVDFSGPSAVGRKDFLWIEGDIDANGAGTGLNLAYTRYAQVRHLSVINASDAAIVLSNGQNNTLRDVAAVHNRGDGIRLADGEGNRLMQVQAADNGRHGVAVFDSENTVITGLNTSSNIEHGLFVSGGRNARITQVLATGNGGDGVHLGDAAVIANYLAAVTAADNAGAGVVLAASVRATMLLNVLAVGNTGDGVVWDTDKNNTVRRVQVADNGNDCLVDGATNCPAEASLINAAELFVGEINTADLLHRHATIDGLIPGAADASVALWVDLGGELRNRLCDANGWCRVMDWRLQAGSDALGGDEVSAAAEEHVFATNPASTVEFLPNALELIGEGVGNDDGLCEAGEACVMATNVGAYVGHGSLQERSLAAGETLPLEGIALLRYSDNGVSDNGV